MNRIKQIQEKIRLSENGMISILIDVPTAQDFVEFLEFKAIEKPPTFEMIDRVVSEIFQISLDQLRERVRNREITTARHLVMFFYRKYYPMLSYREIGEKLSQNGNKPFDHVTVMHALKNIQNLYESDKVYRKIINDTELLIKYSELRK